MEKETATHFSIHAWRIPWTEGLGGLQSIGSQSQTGLKLLGKDVKVHSISEMGVSEIAACPLPPVSDGPSALSTPTSSPSLQSATLLAYSLDSSAGMSAVALYHWAFQRTVYC